MLLGIFWNITYKSNHSIHCLLNRQDVLAVYIHHNNLEIHHIVLINNSLFLMTLVGHKFNSLFFMPEYYSIAWLYYQLFIHSFTGGILGGFQFGGVTKSASLSILGQVFTWTSAEVQRQWLILYSPQIQPCFCMCLFAYRLQLLLN